MIGAEARLGVRHMSMESFYEYGSRVGIWRLFNLFKEYQIPITLFAVAMALQRNQDVAEAALENTIEIREEAAITVKSQFIAKAVPIPAADPCTAAMKSFWLFDIVSNIGKYSSRSCLEGGICPPSFKSAPAQTPGPSPLNITILASLF